VHESPRSAVGPPGDKCHWLRPTAEFQGRPECPRAAAYVTEIPPPFRSVRARPCGPGVLRFGAIGTEVCRAHTFSGVGRDSLSRRWRQSDKLRMAACVGRGRRVVPSAGVLARA
jgi:hypothetical protein